MTTKIVITGATGFIGSALCKRLEKLKEYSIVKVTRSQDKFGFYKVNDYRSTPAGDILIHLGEDTNRIRVNKAGYPYQKKTKEVVKSLLKNNYKKIIYCSTSVVYGDKESEPYNEKMQTYANDTYSTAKLENEKIILSTGGTVVRLSNVLGKEIIGNNVLTDIIRQLSTNEPMILHNIRPIRDFIWIDDVVNAILRLIKIEASGIFNIGTGVPTSIYQLSKIALNISGQKDREINSVVSDAEYSYNVLNIKKLRDLTNWRPIVSVSQSIGKIVNHL